MERFGDMKPIPAPRNRNSSDQQDATNNNDARSDSNRSSNTKPTPLPRKLFQKITSSTSTVKDIKKTPSAKSCQNENNEELVNESKRGTINIFKRSSDADPFEEFEKDFASSHLLRDVSFTSPLQDLTEEERARLSSFSSSSSITNSDSDHYDQIQPSTSKSIQNNSTNVTPKKPERKFLSSSSNSGFSASSVSLKSSVSESKSVYSVITKPKRSNPANSSLVLNRTHFNAPSSIISPFHSSPLYCLNLNNKNDSSFLQLDSSKYASAEEALDTKSTENTKDNEHSIKRKLETVKHDLNVRRDKNRTSEKHDYDEVTIEDGTIVFFDNQLNKRSTGSSSMHSIMMEFDPLFDTTSKSVFSESSQDHESTPNTSELRKTYVVPTEDVGKNEKEEITSDNHPTTHQPCGKSIEKENLDRNLTNVDTRQYELVDNDLKEEDRPSLHEGVATQSPPLKRTDGNGSFLRRLSHRMRLLPIKEEQSSKVSSAEDLANGQARCNKCQVEHEECDFCIGYGHPIPKATIVYSTHLYRTTGILQKDFTKRWVVLANGKLTFYNDKQIAQEDVPLDKVIAISKKEDTKQGSSGTYLKPFELTFHNWKSSTLILSAAQDSERQGWLQKYIETFTSVFSASYTTGFDRAGWCYVKQRVTGDWFPSWFVLKDRILLHSLPNNKQSVELDLRKARSITLSVKDVEHKCPNVDNSDVLTIDMISKILFVQTVSSKVTSVWEKSINAAARRNGDQFHEMQLTLDDVPVTIDKCIDFLYANGTLAEGIYRQSGSNTRITQLLAGFQSNAWEVQLSNKEYSAHDVAGALKRFFRTLPDPLFTANLYKNWIDASRIPCSKTKLEKYEHLLGLLPPINFNILKKLICHLYAVHELHEKNLMPLNNLAPIWGPTLMNVESLAKTSQNLGGSNAQYQSACAESEVVKDLIENYYTLFQIDSASRERERKMQDALENFHLGLAKRKCSGDMKIWIYLWEKDESTAINITLRPVGTAFSIVQQLCKMAQLKNATADTLALHEVICGKALERPLHPSELVIESVLRWSIWGIDERKDNYLILKNNTLYPSLVPYAKDPTPVFGTLKFADSKMKSMKKYSFEFSKAKLTYYKDSTRKEELGSWKIEDIVWYIGTESKRTPTPKWAFTFINRRYLFKRSREEPYFGNVLSFGAEDELLLWIGAMVIGEHPEGLYPPIIV